MDYANVECERPKEADKLLDGEELTTDELEKVSWYVEELLDALNDVAPGGCYFGTHPGDGADFGFWSVDEDVIIEEE